MDHMFLKVGIALVVLLVVGVLLTAYEFREHIAKRFKKK